MSSMIQHVPQPSCYRRAPRQRAPAPVPPRDHALRAADDPEALLTKLPLG